MRIDANADDSLAATRAWTRFGIAMAVIARMMATAIINSTNEKPFGLGTSYFSRFRPLRTHNSRCNFGATLGICTVEKWE